MSPGHRDQVPPLGPWLWLPATFLLIASTYIMLSAGYRFRWTDWVTSLMPSLVFGAIASVLSARFSRRLGFGATAFFQGSIYSLSAMLLTLAAATSSRPLADRLFLQIDQFIGYDWNAYATFIFASPIISSLVLPSYWLIFLQPMIIISLLAYLYRFQEVEKYIIITIISQLITIILFYYFPAAQAWTFLGIDDEKLAMFPQLSRSNRTWVSDLLLIRSGPCETYQVCTVLD